MALELILTVLALIVLLLAAYCDLKTREIPDWLNYSFFFAAIGIRGLFSLEQGGAILLSGILGILAAYAVGYVFYLTRQWGGGDMKLLLGIGAVIGINYPLTHQSFRLLWYFLLLLFMGALYGLVWMSYIAYRERNQFTKAFLKNLNKTRKLHLGSAVLSLGLGLIGMYIPTILPLAFFPLGLFYLLLFVHSVEHSCFLVNVDPEKVTEGDWLAQEVITSGKKMMGRKTLNLQDIHYLQELKATGKIHTVLIKIGIPFVPSFLLAYIALLVGTPFIPWILGFLA